MVERGGPSLGALIGQVVPGSGLREGLERVLRAHMGALVVLGDGPEVLAICSGGFHIDAEMTPQRLSELAKMDGAIVLDRSGSRIAWANVHLVPDPTAPTNETGTRHRTAERVARCVDVPVIAVSEEMGTITLYRGSSRRQMQPTESLLSRANHLLQTIERFATRLEEVRAALSASEIEDVVTLRDVAVAVQRAEMVLRVSEEIDDLLDELGERGRLHRLQADELVLGVAEEQRLLIEDYGLAATAESPGQLQALSTDDLLEPARVVAALTGEESPDLEATLTPRGLRLLRRLPQLSDADAVALVEHFGELGRLVRAPVGEIAEVGGLGEEAARSVKAGIARIAEASILGRFS